MYENVTFKNGKEERLWTGHSDMEPMECDLCKKVYTYGELTTSGSLELCDDCNAHNVCKECGKVGEGVKCQECIDWEVAD